MAAVGGHPRQQQPRNRARGAICPVLQPGAGTFEIEAPDRGGRWQFYSAQVASSSGHGAPQAVTRLATSAERAALLREPGTWTTDSGRVIHLDLDHGLWAEPDQSPARVRVTAAMVRGILLAAGLTEH